MKTSLVYALHSGQLYGTERMALATALGVSDEYAPSIFAPSGAALAEARLLGFEARAFASPAEFARELRPYFARARSIAFVATGVVHSLACVAWQALYRRRIVHLHVVHGGTDERDSYSRKRLLSRLGVRFVAVSPYVKERLVAHGVAPARISVIENFLPVSRTVHAPRRGPFVGRGVRRVLVVSRVDPIKRVDLLLDALDLEPALADLEFRVLGEGWDLDALRRRAAAANPNVSFVGFSSAVAEELAATDLLLHLCPVEPFGLAILEAMVADVPVLVAEGGGAGALIEEGVSGFHFPSDDASALARRLLELRVMPDARLNAAVAGGRRSLAGRFSATARTQDYRRLLHGEVV